MSLHPIHHYHTEVEKNIRFGSTANETAIHSVLFNLLNECPVPMKYTEYDIVEINKNIIMNIGLWIYGNHSIAFNEKKVSSIQEVLNRLNLLKLENSEWLMEMCKQRHSPIGDEKWDKRINEKLNYDMQIRSWRMTIEDNMFVPNSNLYTFDGPFGLYMEISKYYVFIHPWVPHYHLWYWTEKKENIEWRDTWRLIIYQIIDTLGGDSALYFPDSLSELSNYLPIEYNMPKFNQLVQIVFEKYTPCFTSFSEATRCYMENALEHDPFVVDKFEDIETIVKHK